MNVSGSKIMPVALSPRGALSDWRISSCDVNSVQPLSRMLNVTETAAQGWPQGSSEEMQ